MRKRASAQRSRLLVIPSLHSSVFLRPSEKGEGQERRDARAGIPTHSATPFSFRDVGARHIPNPFSPLTQQRTSASPSENAREGCHASAGVGGEGEGEEGERRRSVWSEGRVGVSSVSLARARRVEKSNIAITFGNAAGHPPPVNLHSAHALGRKEKEGRRTIENRSPPPTLAPYDPLYPHSRVRAGQVEWEGGE